MSRRESYFRGRCRKSVKNKPYYIPKPTNRSRSRSPNFDTEEHVTDINKSVHQYNQSDTMKYQQKHLKCNIENLSPEQQVITNANSIGLEYDIHVPPTSELGSKSTTKKISPFDSLCGTDITNTLFHKRIKVDWNDRHLQVMPGLNFLVVCKNEKCEKFLTDVICPRGLFSERNGYCPLDREIYRIKCPICKKLIRPDSSLGIGFFKCEFKVSFMLKASRDKTIVSKAENDCLVFAKCSKPNQEMFQYLDISVVAN